MSVGAASTPGGNTSPCGLPQCLCSSCCIRPTHLLVWEKLRQDLTGRIHHLLGCTGIDELCRGRRGGREGGAAMQFSQKSKGPQWITGPQMGLYVLPIWGETHRQTSSPDDGPSAPKTAALPLPSRQQLPPPRPRPLPP